MWVNVKREMEQDSPDARYPVPADGIWRARCRDEAGREHSKHFARKVDAQQWIDEVTASVVTGNYVDPRRAGLLSTPTSTIGRHGKCGCAARWTQ
jgi:hypothetical protein